jgi:hypothetical protein
MKIKTGIKAGRWNGKQYAYDKDGVPLRDGSCHY